MITAPKDYYLVNFDLAQAETWVVAYLANEPTMKHVLATGDIHRETAQKAFLRFSDEEWNNYDNKKLIRYVGKRYNHATAYRMGPQRAAQVINKDSDKPPYLTVTVAESKVYYSNWHDYYNIKSWWDNIDYQLMTKRTLRTPYGRIFSFLNRTSEKQSREATAAVPQSTVADHLNGNIQDELGIPGGLIEIDKQLVIPGHVRVAQQGHDSLLLEIPRTSARELCERIHTLLLRPLMIEGEEFTIPVDCEIGERWGELEEQPRNLGSTLINFKV